MLGRSVHAVQRRRQLCRCTAADRGRSRRTRLTNSVWRGPGDSPAAKSLRPMTDGVTEMVRLDRLAAAAAGLASATSVPRASSRAVTTTISDRRRGRRKPSHPGRAWAGQELQRRRERLRGRAVRRAEIPETREASARGRQRRWSFVWHHSERRNCSWRGDAARGPARARVAAARADETRREATCRAVSSRNSCAIAANPAASAPRCGAIARGVVDDEQEVELAC